LLIPYSCEVFFMPKLQEYFVNYKLFL